ncbi:hypothetical protein ABFS82_12G054900 [Erythranthe guttata]|uniref:uncharacterized protein LOC105949878 n=1 Tax=Erythranthe guttata TaxID=4155 RepID=UPI00064D810B|nr:PREDICTED: uncharacterized protein LOC105949878 [Erythranthe guttata]|eukprot:XP_012828640.1 PREDICTED: uncharacterized protein LOC105949878 [Erythranthe guttata]
MGSVFHLLDINEEIMARKSVTHKRHDGGLEAPRNSLELSMETSYGLYSARDNILYAPHMSKESSGKDYYSTDAPIKKLISEEISKRPSSRQSSPSVIARLMGVDMLPFDSKPAPPQPVDNNIKKEHRTGKLTMDKKEVSKTGSVDDVISSLGRHYEDIYPDQLDIHMKLDKPKPREHPQEQELQKFKKEFEAWQAARFNQCSNVVKFSNAPAQIIAQEDLNREKMHLYFNSKKTANSDRLNKPNDPAKLVVDPLSKKKNLSHSNRISRTDSTHKKPSNDIVSSPTKIVILRPGPDRMDINEDMWSSTPSTSEGRATSIEDFLQEVKERLKSELQGNSSTTIRGGGIETPYREKPRKIAQSIAQQVRDSVTTELGMNLVRSESTRSYRSETQFNGTTGSSPEFINRDTRRFLTERLRNVMTVETHQEFPTLVRNSSRFSVSDYGQSRDKMSYHESLTNDLEKQSRSFRGETDLSPMNLVRSLSAPVSGTSFGKLLLEDRNILTGAHIRRKHEVVEKAPPNINIKKQKKEKFNIREKVSSFRYSLTLRGRLFQRRVKSVSGSDQNRNSLVNDIRSGPTVMMSFFETNENSTEVPPSPASVCSSVHEEFWRTSDYLSPISSAGGHQLDDSDMSHVFREINSNLNELRRKLNQFEGAAVEEPTKDQQPSEVELDIEDEAEAYIQDLLVAAGFYDGSFSRSLSKWDPLGKPISAQVFEEVEETHKQTTKDDEMCRKDEGEQVSHKIVVDLLNELLPAILREPTNMSTYMEKAAINGGNVFKPPYGRKLLSRVWSAVGVYVHPPQDRSYYSLDSMLARNLKSDQWLGSLDDDVTALCRDIECLIIGDMIDEMIKDIDK